MRALFAVRGFFPYILAIFLNAFTDLGHKIIIQNTVFMVYNEQTQIILTAIVNALILLPSVLLFTPAGFVSDRFAKSIVLRRAALMAVALTIGITISYYQGWFVVAFALTFLLATQSAFYAPAKYGYIKDLGGNEHLSAGNAAAQSVTTVAILAGIIVYTLLFEGLAGARQGGAPSEYVRLAAPLGWLLILGSLAEWVLLFYVPLHNAAQPGRRFRVLHYVSGAYLRRNMRIVFKNRNIARAIIALSIYWGIAQVVLAVFGAYAKMHLGETSVSVVQGVMALTGVGIMAGAWVAAEYSKARIRMGLVPLGIGGMALMLVLLPLMPDVVSTAPVFFAFGIFAGAFLVPLNAYIQRYAPQIHLGTVLAGNNFIQTVFMLVGLALTTVIAYNGADAVMVMWLCAVVAVVTFAWLTRLHALEFLWLLGSLLVRCRYAVTAEGAEHVPGRGPVLLLGNHVSWMDWILVQLPQKRRLRFMMERRIYHWKLLHWMFRLGRTIPVSSRASKSAFEAAFTALQGGDALVVFPEGGMTERCEVEAFHRGFERIASRCGSGSIVPFYIHGMCGSRWSRTPGDYPDKGGGVRRHVIIRYGDPLPMNSSTETVREAVIRLKEPFAE